MIRDRDEYADEFQRVNQSVDPENPSTLVHTGDAIGYVAGKGGHNSCGIER
jgi:hypothetical protein